MPEFGSGHVQAAWYRCNRLSGTLTGARASPTHEQIIEARDDILAKYPDLVVIGAHLGRMEHDLDGLAQRLDRFPNFNVDVSARTYVLQRQPAEKARQFFMKYQDGIFYGTDSDAFTPGEEPSKEKRLAFTQKMEDTYRADFAY